VCSLLWLPLLYLRENHWRKFLACFFVYRKLGILKSCILCKLASMQMFFCYDVSVTHWHYLYIVHSLMWLWSNTDIRVQFSWLLNIIEQSSTAPFPPDWTAPSLQQDKNMKCFTNLDKSTPKIFWSMSRGLDLYELDESLAWTNFCLILLQRNFASNWSSRRECFGWGKDMTFLFANYISILRYLALYILIKIFFILFLMQNIIIQFG